MESTTLSGVPGNTPREAGKFALVTKSLSELLDMASTLNSKAEHIANRFLGPIPSTEAERDQKTPNDAYVDLLLGGLRETQQYLQGLEVSLSRIEREME